MNRLRKLVVFLVLLSLFSALSALLFWDLGVSCVSILRTGVGDGTFLMVTSDPLGRVYVLERKNGAYRLVIGGQSGRQLEQWLLDERALPPESRPTALYSAGNGTVYLGLYSIEDSSAALQVYQISEKGKAVQLLLSEPCRGDCLPEQMDNVRLSDFSSMDGEVTFAVIQGDMASFYQESRRGDGLECVMVAQWEGLRQALALSNGEQVLATESGLLRTGYAPAELEQGEIITRLHQAGTGVCYIDGAGLGVFRADFADWRPYRYLTLEKNSYSLDDITNLSLTWEGDALLLVNGERLLLDRDGTVTDLSGILYRPQWQCALILAGLVLGILALTFIFWYLLCEVRRMRIPMLLRWGALTAAAAVLGMGGFLRLAVEPAYQAAAQREAENLLDSITSLHLNIYQLTDPQLPELLGESIGGAHSGLYWDTVTEVYQFKDGHWTLASGGAGRGQGIRAELLPGFDRGAAEQALQENRAFWVRRDGDETHYILYRGQGDSVLCADVNGTRLLRASEDSYLWMKRGMGALAGLFTAVMFALLFWTTRGVRVVIGGMERLAAGKRDINIHTGVGDELESLAEDVNALAVATAELERRHSELTQSYRRFVPEQMLSLLGKENIAEVDQHTIASRHLAAMMLSFQFPEEVYTSGARELFDSVNEILERTASIVTQKGGTVFNFAYDGYDAVFQGGSAAAVSTAVAVQQEVLKINQEHALAGRPQVSVRIALDEGDVMLGGVGDGRQLEPASISSSFSVIRHLIDLCARLEANVLCTEAIMSGAEGYASRYMGKCRQGGVMVRTYEIFDGDPYEERKIKEQTCARFSDGVCALYSRDFAKAKRIFLKLVYSSSLDGGARYYLYLADQMEKKADEEISLELGL